MGKFIYNESSIKVVYLMMGFNCNFNCRHCIQSGCNSPVLNVSDTTFEYIHHLISVRPEHCEKLRLMFWGGEPLLYMNVIRSVIERFGESLKYSLVTNGSLLTQEIVDYLNENKVHVALSYDGKNTKNIRLRDVTEDSNFLKLFNSIRDRAVCAVMSAHNYDFAALFKEVDSKFGKETPLTVELLKVTWDMPKDLYDIDLDKYRELLHNIAEQALTDLLQGNYTREIAFFYPYLKQLIAKRKMPLSCGQGYNVMNIDLSGNIYPCHNVSEKIGTAKDERYLQVKKQTEWVEKGKAPACEECNYNIICNGGCPNDLIEEHGERLTCKINKILYDEVFWIAAQVENSFSELDLEV